jgi:hypothetical protein
MERSVAVRAKGMSQQPMRIHLPMRWMSAAAVGAGDVVLLWVPGSQAELAWSIGIAWPSTTVKETGACPLVYVGRDEGLICA